MIIQTSRLYIDARTSGTQTLSCEELAHFSAIRSIPKELPRSGQPMKLATKGQPFICQGMQIQYATHLMREVCALRLK